MPTGYSKLTGENPFKGKSRPSHPAWNKGGVNLKIRGKKNYLWKGEKASYGTKHTWLYRNFGKANKCEKCDYQLDPNKTRNFSWSNISGKYKRTRTDWMMLCYSCHKKYDIKRLGLVIWNKGIKQKDYKKRHEDQPKLFTFR